MHTQPIICVRNRDQQYMCYWHWPMMPTCRNNILYVRLRIMISLTPTWRNQHHQNIDTMMCHCPNWYHRNMLQNFQSQNLHQHRVNLGQLMTCQPFMTMTTTKQNTIFWTTQTFQHTTIMLQQLSRCHAQATRTTYATIPPKRKVLKRTTTAKNQATNVFIWRTIISHPRFITASLDLLVVWWLATITG